jgi:uncharacterized protein (DUF952 family)
MIYHAITQNDWQEARKQGYYEPESIAEKGYIRCSSLEQIIAITDLYFTKRGDLVLVEIDESKVQSNVVLEDLHGHGRFPHIYGRLNLDAVVAIHALLMEDNPESKVKFKLPPALVQPAVVLKKLGR